MPPSPPPATKCSILAPLGPGAWVTTHSDDTFALKLSVCMTQSDAADGVNEPLLLCGPMHFSKLGFFARLTLLLGWLMKPMDGQLVAAAGWLCCRAAPGTTSQSISL